MTLPSSTITNKQTILAVLMKNENKPSVGSTTNEFQYTGSWKLLCHAKRKIQSIDYRKKLYSGINASENVKVCTGNHISLNNMKRLCEVTHSVRHMHHVFRL